MSGVVSKSRRATLRMHVALILIGLHSAAAASCPWINGTATGLQPYNNLCFNGESCNTILFGLHCCSCRGGLAQCGLSSPNMCEESPGVYVCLIEDCEGIGGTYRPCDSPPETPTENCLSPPSLPPAPPQLPMSPASPSPPLHPPGPAGEIIVSSVSELRDALLQATAPRIVLRAQGYSYVLDAELQVTRQVIIEAELGGGEVIIDAAASEATPRRVMRIFASANVTLIGLTLTGAWMPQGSDPGGGAIANEGTLEMVEMVVRANHAYVGGGVFSTGPLRMRGCTFAENSARFIGGGLMSIELVRGTVLPSTVEAIDCTFELNNATYGAALGLMQNCEGTFTRTRFLHNTATDRGGAIDNFGSLSLEQCHLVHNVAEQVGGGVESSGNGATLIMRDCHVLFNMARNIHGGGLAIVKGVFAANTTAELINTNVAGNFAPLAGGIFSSGSLTVHGSHLVDNTSPGLNNFSGTALYNTGYAVLFGTIVAENIAPSSSYVQNLYNGGELLYIMPAPKGYYMAGIFQCQQELCQTSSAIPTPCDIQSCDYEQFGDKWMVKFPQGGHETEVPSQCGKGYYGNRQEFEDQNDFTCTALCPGGMLCDRRGTVDPSSCPDGCECPRFRICLC